MHHCVDKKNKTELAEAEDRAIRQARGERLPPPPGYYPRAHSSDDSARPSERHRGMWAAPGSGWKPGECFDDWSSDGWLNVDEIKTPSRKELSKMDPWIRDYWLRVDDFKKHYPRTQEEKYLDRYGPPEAWADLKNITDYDSMLKNITRLENEGNITALKQYLENDLECVPPEKHAWHVMSSMSSDGTIVKPTLTRADKWKRGDPKVKIKVSRPDSDGLSDLNWTLPDTLPSDDPDRHLPRIPMYSSEWDENEWPSEKWGPFERTPKNLSWPEGFLPLPQINDSLISSSASETVESLPFEFVYSTDISGDDARSRIPGNETVGRRKSPQVPEVAPAASEAEESREDDWGSFGEPPTVIAERESRAEKRSSRFTSVVGDEDSDMQTENLRRYANFTENTKTAPPAPKPKTIWDMEREWALPEDYRQNSVDPEGSGHIDHRDADQEEPEEILVSGDDSEEEQETRKPSYV